MATKINTDIWGAESTWIDVNNPPVDLPYALTNYVFSGTLGGLQSIDAKLAYLPKSGYSSPANEYFRCSWRGAFLGKQYNPDDEEKIVFDYNSPVPFSQLPVTWGIGKDSAIANPVYVLGGYRSGTATEIQQDGVTLFLFDHDLYRDIQKKTIPFCFSTGQKNTTSTQLNYQNRNYELPVGANYVSYNGVLNGQPLMSFNYQKVVVYPVLIVGVYDNNSPTGISGIQECTISDYFDGENAIKNTKPLILSIVIKYWYMGAENQTANGRNQIDKTFFSGVSGGVFYEQEQDSSIFMYSGTERLVQSIVRDGTSGSRGYQSIVSNIVPNGVIAGGLGTLAPEVLTAITPSSHVDEENRAWIVATQTNPLFRTAYLNGKFKVHAQQYKNPNSTYTNQIYWCTVWDTTIDTATKDDILKEVAYLGFWFSEDLTVARTGKTGTACDSSLMHIPVFDSDGVTTGEWKSGTDAAQEPNALWNNPYEDNPYVPSGGGGENDDFGDLGNGSRFGRFPNYLKIWITDVTEFEGFVNAVNELYITDPDGVQQWQLDFKGVNPSDYIVSAYVAPFEIPKTTGTFPIQLGVVTFDSSVVPSGIMAYKYAHLGTDSDGNVAGNYDCGSVSIPAYYGDFRDYSPYTTIELYIPMCGTVNLSPEFFIGHSVNVQYFYDVYTMSLSAGIYRDGVTLYKVVNGVAGCEIPLTSLRMGDYQNAVHNIEQALKRNEMSTAFGALTLGASAAGAVATGGASLLTAAGALTGSKGIIQGLDERQDLYYDLTHTQPSIAQTSAAEAQNNFCVGGVYPHIFIKRAKMQGDYDANVYSHTVGNACIIQSTIGDMSGLIKCGSVDLSGIPATADEITAINNALKSGIYV